MTFFQARPENTIALSLGDTSLTLRNGNIAIGKTTYNAHIRIINPETREVVRRISQFNDSVDCMIQLRDGNIAVGGTMSSADIRIINPETGELVSQISQAGSGITNSEQLQAAINRSQDPLLGAR